MIHSIETKKRTRSCSLDCNRINKIWRIFYTPTTEGPNNQDGPLAFLWNSEAYNGCSCSCYFSGWWWVSEKWKLQVIFIFQSNTNVYTVFRRSSFVFFNLEMACVRVMERSCLKHFGICGPSNIRSFPTGRCPYLYVGFRGNVTTSERNSFYVDSISIYFEKLMSEKDPSVIFSVVFTGKWNSYVNGKHNHWICFRHSLFIAIPHSFVVPGDY